MHDGFEDLLNELGIELGLSLKPDSLGACTLRIDDDFPLQMEVNPTTRDLQLAISVCEVSPGKFRENVLLHALKVNNLQESSYGAFGYSSHQQQLVLFWTHPLEDLTGEKLASFIGPLIEKAKLWKEAIESGHPAPPEEMRQTAPKAENPFGLRP